MRYLNLKNWADLYWNFHRLELAHTSAVSETMRSEAQRAVPECVWWVCARVLFVPQVHVEVNSLFNGVERAREKRLNRMRAIKVHCISSTKAHCLPSLVVISVDMKPSNSSVDKVVKTSSFFPQFLCTCSSLHFHQMTNSIDLQRIFFL